MEVEPEVLNEEEDEELIAEQALIEKQLSAASAKE